jgi:hypothetical protein
VLSQDLIDMPIEVFGGYVPALAPSVMPPGSSPSTQDCYFPEGAVATRPGLFALFGPAGGVLPGGVSINGLKSYLTPQLNRRMMVWDSSGNLYKESPDGTLTLLFARPQGASMLYQSTTLFGRDYEAFYNVNGGVDIPRQYDDMNWDRVSHSGPGKAPAAVDSGTAGTIAAGLHQVTVAFINRQGFISQYAPNPTTWTAAGAKQVALTAIATGPPNIIARLLLFTPVITPPATTGSFYSLPVGTTQLATPTVMLINDNVTTTLTVDFTDAILIAGFQGNYLATERTLGESQCAFGYSSRLGWLSERNRQQNFVNMDFDGGFGGAPVAANSGVLSPSTSSQLPNGGNPWVGIGNIFVADGVVASAAMPIGQASDFILATGYGLAVPLGATITGVAAVVRASASVANQVSDFQVYLVYNGAIIGITHGNGNLLTVALANQAYGSPVDTWGAALTTAKVNDPTFGLAYSALNNDAFTRTANVDYISIIVYYTTQSAGGTLPLGWTAGAAVAGGSSALTSGYTPDWGDAYAITGDGATAKRGEINQSAYQDYLLASLIARGTAYRVRVRLAKVGALTQGVLHINLQSTTGGFTTAGLAVNASALTANYKEFDALLTAAIVSPPADLLIQVYADGTPTNAGVILVDSIEPYPANAPYNYSTAFLSHSFNPESYDNTTSSIQVRPNDGTQLRAAAPIRNNMYLMKDHYMCYVTDDGVNEPASWPVNEVSATVGCCGPNAVDWTEEWFVTAERSGLYIVWGSDPVKITPEIQQDATSTGKVCWNSINWQYGHTIWVRIDKVNKQILVGAPVGKNPDGGIITTPNTVFMLDYKWLEGASDIAASPMVTYSAFTGKVLSHGRGRRWMLWNIKAASMAYIERADGTVQPFFGNNSNNGKIYQQIATQYSDDGVAINSFYATYYSPSHVEEQIVQLGAHQKLLGYLKWRAFGSGILAISVITVRRTTVLRGYILSLTPAGDGERGLEISGERFSFQFGTNAVGSYFQLEQVVPCLKKHPTMVVRGVNA